MRFKVEFNYLCSHPDLSYEKFRENWWRYILQKLGTLRKLENVLVGCSEQATNNTDVTRILCTPLLVEI